MVELAATNSDIEARGKILIIVDIVFCFSM